MSNSMPIAGAGRVIRDLRIAANLTQERLAQIIGVEHTRISKIENNHLELNPELIGRIANAVGRRPEAVMLECLKLVYPSLGDTPAGKLLERAIRTLNRS